MAYPTSTFQRSDSQSGFYTQTQQQRSSASTGQQGQQSQSSHPRFESRSSSRSTTAQQQLSEFYGDDGDDDNWEEDKFHGASETVRQIGQKIRSISGGDDVDIEGLIELFRQIKKAQKDGDLSYLRSCKPTLLESLSDPLGQLLKKLANNFQSEASLVACLNTDDIHALFNGLSAIVGESVNESLFAKAHFNKVRDSLGNITEALLEHVIKKMICKIIGITLHSSICSTGSRVG